MAITGDRYEGTFEGHPIALVRNNLTKGGVDSDDTIEIDGNPLALKKTK